MTSFDKEVFLGHLSVKNRFGFRIKKHILKNVFGGNSLMRGREESKAHGLFSFEIQLRSFKTR
jgi:hypothetical protein